MAVSNNPNSARQKMINLMYLVFIAMMALNIPAEVLDGFVLVDNSLKATTENSTIRNKQITANLHSAYLANPAKVGEWHALGTKVEKQSDEIFDYLGELKLRIVKEADGKDGDVNNIKRKENLDAAASVMLSPITGEGKKLKERIEGYRTDMSGLVDPSKKAIFESILSTKPKGTGPITHSWEDGLFENMPVAAVVTLLTKMQNDVRYIEGEVLSTLIKNIDEKDFRVNKVEALVIPKSQVVTSGMPFEAQLVLAAVDSTRRPEYFIGGNKLDNEWITIPSGGVGEHVVKGEIVADGQTYEYSTSYSVTASSAIVAPTLTSFLYESIENPVELGIPGVPSGAVRASIEGGGRIEKKLNEDNIWIVSGLDAAKSKLVKVVLTASVGGRSTTVNKEIKVRPLPPPAPFISYKDENGTTRKFKAGRISKGNLVNASGIEAAIDDGTLDIPYTVTGFTLMSIGGMGNDYIPEVSNSGEFTQRQRDIIRDMGKGKRFFISNVKALDPAGKSVSIDYSMEVIVN